MAVIDITANATYTFDSTDAVTWKTGGDIGNGNNVTKTDTLGMTINMDDGISNTISGTGYVDIQGDYGEDNLVLFESNNANKKAGRWSFFNFTGSSTSNTMKHVGLFNAAGGGGIVFRGHTPAVGKFSYMIHYNSILGPLNTGTSGGVNLSDVYSVNCVNSIQNVTVDTTVNGLTVYRNTGGSSVTGGNLTINDFAIIDTGATLVINTPVSTTANITGLWVGRTNIAGNLLNYTGAGVINVNSFSIELLSNILLRMGGLGTFNALDGDLLGAFLVGYGAVYRASGTMTMDNMLLEGNGGAALGNIDVSTTDPSTSDPIQYKGTGLTPTNPRSTRLYPLTFNTIANTPPTADAFSVTCNTGMLAKVRVKCGTTSGTYTMTSEWTVRPFVLPNGLELEMIVSDFKVAGEKYAYSHAVNLVNLKADTTYYWVLEAVGATGEAFPISAEQTIATTSSGMADNVQSLFTVSLSTGTNYSMEMN